MVTCTSTGDLLANVYSVPLLPTLPHSPAPSVMNYGMTLVCAQVHAHLPVEFLEYILRLHLI